MEDTPSTFSGQDFPDSEASSASEKVNSTPPTNRGVLLADISRGLDYLTFYRTGVSDSWTSERDFLTNLWGTKGERRIYGRGFSMCEGVDTFNGFGMVGTRERPDGLRDICINVPGQACAWLREERGVYLPDFIGMLQDRGYHTTTIDTTIDVRHPSVTPDIIYKWWKKGKVVCKVQFRNVGGQCGCFGWETIYAPRNWKDAEGFWRIYNKQLEVWSKLRIDIGPHTRLEYRSKGERARLLGEKLASLGEGYIGPYMAGLIDFKTTSEDVYRARSMGWWKKAVGQHEEYLQLMRGISTPETSTKACIKQYAKTLKMISKYTPDVLDDAIIEAEVEPEKEEQWKTYVTKIKPQRDKQREKGLPE